MVQEPSYSTACGIFLDQGLNPYLLQWRVESSPLSHQGSLNLCLNKRGLKTKLFSAKNR